MIDIGEIEKLSKLYPCHDLHTHSSFSDGADSPEEMVLAARRAGVGLLAITDHVHRDTLWLADFRSKIGEIKKQSKEIILLAGIEAKAIDTEGGLDAKEDFFGIVDIAIGSIHGIPDGKGGFFKTGEGDKKEILDCWMAATSGLMKNPRVQIIGHITQSLDRRGIALDRKHKEYLSALAKEYGKIIEINLKHQTPDAEFLEILKNDGVSLVTGSDSHSAADFVRNHAADAEDGPKKENPFVSIIIPCRDEEKFIAGCLKTVLGQDYPKDRMEILVIDGMSTDRTRDIIKEFARNNPQVRLLENLQKFTSSAFNIGIKSARGERLIFMGAHASYSRDYVRRCVEFSLKTGADNVGGAVKVAAANESRVAKAIAAALSSRFGSGNARYKTSASESVSSADTVFGGCYKKDVFKKIGPFNENLARSQDMELNIRLKKAGGKIMIDPGIVAYYYPKPDLKDFFIHNFSDGVWAVYPAKFVRSPLKLRHYLPLFAVLGLAAAVAVSFFWPPAILVLASGALSYLVLSLLFSMPAVAKEKDLSYLFLMPAAFAARHSGYGMGSFYGIIKLILPIKNGRKD